MLPRARPERFPWFQCAGAFRRTTAPVIHPMGTSSRTLARIGIALDIACGIVLHPLLELTAVILSRIWSGVLVRRPPRRVRGREAPRIKVVFIGSTSVIINGRLRV